MPIFQAGSLNTTALIVPDLYVVVLPPNLLLINGVPTNIIGTVGAATWGPVNQPVSVSGGNLTQFASFFGSIQPRKYDLGTFTALAVLQGAQAFLMVRVTDGTDTAATNSIITATDLTQQITVAGTPHAGDVLTETFVTPNVVVTYTMQSGDTTQTGAVGLANQINANVILSAAGVTADVPIAGVFKLHYGVAPVSVTASVTGGGATTSLTNASAGSTPNVLAITFNSIYTGSNGNSEVVNITNGSAVGTWRVVISIPGFVPETFDNIGQNQATGAIVKGNAVWQAMASAINNGVSGIRGKSNLLTAVAGQSGATPTVQQITLTGGTDGYAGITTATMLGIDSPPRTGMYALRNQACSIGALVDVFDSAAWSTQVSFGLFEGIYFMIPGPPSDTIANATAPITGTKAAAGIDSYAVKMIFGDYVFWFDPVNNLQRLVSPQGPYCGLLSNLSPQNSTLNKQMFGLIGTQKSATGLTYADQSDLASLSTSGWDVIANPLPQGSVFGSRMGRNASSNAVIHGDNYTRMTNFIAATLNRTMGIFVGQLQSRRPTDKTRAAVKATSDAFFQALLDQGMIDDFQNVCDLTNNPINRIALGYLQLDCQVVYLAVVEYFIVNLMGGQSVQINKLQTQPLSTFAATPNSSLISAA